MWGRGWEYLILTPVRIIAIRYLHKLAKQVTRNVNRLMSREGDRNGNQVASSMGKTIALFHSLQESTSFAIVFDIIKGK